MGSGCFPLDPDSEEADDLLHAAELIQRVCSDLISDVYSGESGGQQFDNAASDGGELALLSLAAQLCRDAVRKKVW